MTNTQLFIALGSLFITVAAAQLATIKWYVDARFSAIDARLDSLDRRFETLLGKVIEIDNRLTRLEERSGIR